VQVKILDVTRKTQICSHLPKASNTTASNSSQLVIQQHFFILFSKRTFPHFIKMSPTPYVYINITNPATLQREALYFSKYNISLPISVQISKTELHSIYMPDLPPPGRKIIICEAYWPSSI